MTIHSVYETDRLFLQLSHPSMAARVLDYFKRNRDFLQATDAAHPADFFTLKYQQRYLANDVEAREQGQSVRFWIVKKCDPERIIGTAAINNIIWGCFLNGTLGYRLDKDEIGQGYMPEALRVVTDVAFYVLGLHRLDANIMPRNVQSLRVAEKLGFRNHALMPSYLLIGGVWEDHYHMVRFHPETDPDF